MEGHARCARACARGAPCRDRPILLSPPPPSRWRRSSTEPARVRGTDSPRELHARRRTCPTSRASRPGAHARASTTRRRRLATVLPTVPRRARRRRPQGVDHRAGARRDRLGAARTRARVVPSAPGDRRGHDRHPEAQRDGAHPEGPRRRRGSRRVRRDARRHPARAARSRPADDGMVRRIPALRARCPRRRRREEGARGPVVVTVRRSKRDQEEGRGARLVPYASNPALCPVRALAAWLEAAHIESGPIFRGVDQLGHVAAEALNDRSVARIVQRVSREVRWTRP